MACRFLRQVDRVCILQLLTGGTDVAVQVDAIGAIGHAAHDTKLLMCMAHRGVADRTGKAVRDAHRLSVQVAAIAVQLTVQAPTQTTPFPVIYAYHCTTFCTTLQT